MKKIYFIIINCLFFFLLFSCVTTNQVEYGKTRADLSPLEFENDDLVGTISFNSGEWVSLNLKNKTENVLQLITDLSTYSSFTGETSKLVPEGTKYIDVKNSQPSIVISPKSNFTKSFFSADSVYYQSGKYGGWRTSNWLPNTLEDSTFVFCYKINGEDKYIIFDGNNSVSNIPSQKNKIGTIDSNKTYWHILFIGNPEKNREELYNLALEKAKNKYGEKIKLYNLRYEGKLSAASLLLYFSFLGYVENATLIADVYEIKN